MSNRSKQGGQPRQPAQGPTLADLAKMVGAAASKIREAQAKSAQASGEPQLAEHVEDPSAVTGNLLRPLSQEIGVQCITWRWETLDGNVAVIAQFLLKDDKDFGAKSGEYLVTLHFGEKDSDFVFSGYDSKAVADVLLSAHHWQFIWRQHAGDFLVESLMTPHVEVTDPAQMLKHPSEMTDEERANPNPAPRKKAPAKRTPKKAP